MPRALSALRATASRTALRAVALALIASLVAAWLGVAVAPAATAAGVCNALVAASASASSSNGGNVAANAIDGNAGTRWESVQGNDAEYLQVDLGAVTSVCGVTLTWEAAYGADYDIQVSTNGTDWTTAHQVRGQSAAGVTPLTFASEANARYVRMQGITRATGYGYSLFEMAVTGDDAALDLALGDGSIPGAGGDLICGRDLVNAGGVTATASHGTGSDAINGNVWARWDSGTVETPSGSGNWVGRDGEWIQLSLGGLKATCGIKLYWEDAYAADYDIEASSDGVAWTTLAQVRGVTGPGAQLHTWNPTPARYLKVTAVTRGTQWGVSLWDIEVLEPRNVDLPTTSLLGDRVIVFDPAMDGADIQAIMDATFAAQETAQFGSGRWQFMFLPGAYSVDARLGFYTSLSGAGLDPTDVTITGGDWVDAEWFSMNATQNFWRSAENLQWNPTGGVGRWATSQAAPLRRVLVDGVLETDSGRYGWASGGFIADSEFTGGVRAFAQQQYFTRDSSVGTWEGGVWNLVFAGVEGDFKDGGTTTTIADASLAWPAPPVTDLATTGPTAEKPYLYLSGSDIESAADWSVRVPSLRDGTTGTTWSGGPTPGADVPLTDFFIARPGDTASALNAALASGKNLLFTPGTYQLDAALDVTRPGTVVLGLGFATLMPTAGTEAMRVADVDGVRIAGLLLDAGIAESPALITVGSEGQHTDHSADPIVLSDVFARVGGVVAGKVHAAVEIDADDTIVDNLWAWRADHGDGVGWDVNPSAYGLIVGGENVSAYGLFVEHFQMYNVVWGGNGGRTLFFQNELPYDVPSQDAWRNGNRKGYAAYKVEQAVTSHEAWGLGSYSYFTEDTEANEFVVDNGFEVPQVAGVTMHHMFSISISGEGIYEHVINNAGPRQDRNDTTPVYIETYPTGGVDPVWAPVDGPALREPASLVLDRSVTPPARPVRVTGDGFEPGEAVEVWLHSDPVQLTTVVADALGEISVVVTVPGDAPTGSHHVVATGVVSGVTAEAALAVAVELAETGPTESRALAFAAALVTAGVALVATRRNRAIPASVSGPRHRA